MSNLSKTPTVVNIGGSFLDVTKTYLRVYLAPKRLTEKELSVTASLVTRYSKLAEDNVKEPYASTLLFSTKSRKELVDELSVSNAHLNNTFKTLVVKGILAREDGEYLINPELIPASELTFRFAVAK